MAETADKWLKYHDEVDRQLDELKLDFMSQERRGRVGTVRAHNYFDRCFKDGTTVEEAIKNAGDLLVSYV